MDSPIKLKTHFIMFNHPIYVVKFIFARKEISKELYFTTSIIDSLLEFFVFRRTLFLHSELQSDNACVCVCVCQCV